MKPRPTQFLLMHCPAGVAEELDQLSQQNFLTRTEFLIIALRTMADYLEETGMNHSGNWRDGLVPLPGDFDHEEDAEEVLQAAEEEEGYDIAPDAEICDIPIWSDQIRHLPPR